MKLLIITLLLTLAVIPTISTVFATHDTDNQGLGNYDPGIEVTTPAHDLFFTFTDNISTPAINKILEFLFPHAFDEPIDPNDPIVLEYFTVNQVEIPEGQKEVTVTTSNDNEQRTLKITVNSDGSVSSTQETVKITPKPEQNNDDSNNNDDSTEDDAKPDTSGQADRDRVQLLINKYSIILQQIEDLPWDHPHYNQRFDILDNEARKILHELGEILKSDKEKPENNSESNNQPQIFIETPKPPNPNQQNLNVNPSSYPWKGGTPEPKPAGPDPQFNLNIPDGGTRIPFGADPNTDFILPGDPQQPSSGGDNPATPFDGTEPPTPVDIVQCCDEPGWPYVEGPTAEDLLTPEDYDLILDNEDDGYNQYADPIVWPEPDYGFKEITYRMMWDESYESQYYPKQDLMWFDINCNGTLERMDREYVDVPMLFIDFAVRDGTVTCGAEILIHPYLTGFVIMEKLDSSKDGSLTEEDDVWPMVKVAVWREDNTWDIYDPSSFGIIGFNHSKHYSIKNDCFGLGVYSDGYKGYVHDTAFHNCRIDGGLSHIRTITDDHFRLNGLNEQGIEYEDGSTKRAYGAVVGIWPLEPNMIGDFRSLN